MYNVTPYVEEHPGGDAILNNAGGDSTKGFYGFVPIMQPMIISLKKSWLFFWKWPFQIS